MARIVHGFHLTKGRKQTLRRAFFLVVIIGAILLIGQIGSSAQKSLTGALLISLARLFFSYLLSLAISVVLVVLIGNNRLGDMLIPVFDLFQNLPSFALIPLFILWLGNTSLMAIVFAATSILWPILFYMLHALRTANQDLSDAATIFGARGLKRVFNFSLPVIFPAAVTGSIVGISIGWEAIIGIEIIGLGGGIGTFLNQASGADNQKILWLGITALLLVVFLINRLVWMPLIKKTQIYGD